MASDIALEPDDQTPACCADPQGAAGLPLDFELDCAIAPPQEIEVALAVSPPIGVPADPVLAAAEVDRVTAILNQIEGATITATYKSGRVAVAGTVNQTAAVQPITQAFEQIPGVRSIATAIRVQPLPVNVRGYFGIASAEVSPTDRRGKLSQVKAQLDRNPTQIFSITGYSNPVDGARETQWLAMQRAKAVRDALVRQGVPPNQLQASFQYPSSSLNQPTWLGRYAEIRPLVSVSQP